MNTMIQHNTGGGANDYGIFEKMMTISRQQDLLSSSLSGLSSTSTIQGGLVGGNVILNEIVSIVFSDFDHNNTTHNQTRSGVNWEQFPQGVLSAIVAFVSLVWLCFSLKGIFKNQISLQRKLFFMIFCTCSVRTAQSLIFNQICFRHNRDSEVCPTISKVSQILDIYTSSFNFVIYLILGLYWAEQYFTLKKIQDEDLTRASNSSDHHHHQQSSATATSSSAFAPVNSSYFLKVRRVINIAFWILSVLSFLFVTPFAALIVAMDRKGFGYSTVAYQVSRLIIRLVLSWGVCLTLIVFGVLVFKLYRRSKLSSSDLSSKNIQKVAIITIVCTTAYFFLSITNIVSTIEWEWYQSFEYAYVFYIVFALIELFANSILLAFLPPKPIVMTIAVLFSNCCSRKNVGEEGFAARNKLFYENIVSLDNDDDSIHDEYYSEQFTEEEDDSVSEHHVEESSSIIRHNFSSRQYNN